MARPEQLLPSLNPETDEDTKKKIPKPFKPKNILLPSLQERELVRNIPTYNIESLFRNIGKFNVTVAGKGHYSVVFRIQSADTAFPADMTVKLFRFNCPTTPADIRKMLQAAGTPSPDANKIAWRLTSGWREPYKTHKLVERQIAGHVLGSAVAPDHIDHPICMWVKNQGDTVEPVGYSLPFVIGEHVRIAEHAEATGIGNYLEANYNLYVGSRGSYGDDRTYNAIITPDGVTKFIDVRIQDPENYSFPG